RRGGCDVAGRSVAATSARYGATVNAESMVGRLLVATSQLTDPNFAKTVILLLSHDDDGALGVVLDQPTEVRVADVLPAWGEVLTEPDVLFHGGPVGADSA